MTGAVSVETLKGCLERAGFKDVEVIDKERSDEIIRSWQVGEGVEKAVFSAYIKAKKPTQ